MHEGKLVSQKLNRSGILRFANFETGERLAVNSFCVSQRNEPVAVSRLAIHEFIDKPRASLAINEIVLLADLDLMRYARAAYDAQCH